MNFNTNYDQLLTTNTGGYMGGGVGTSQQSNVQNNGMGSGWLSDMFGALPGTLNAVGNLIHGPTTPNIYVNQTPNPMGGGNSMWWIIGAVAAGAIILVVALK